MSVKTSAPVLGFNHNLKFGPRIYHVQTEDSGLPHAHCITHLFVGGNILASMKASYAERAYEPELPKLVRSLMEAQHKAMVRRLVAGEFNEKVEQIAAHYEPGVLATGQTGPAAVNMGGNGAAHAEAPVQRAPASPRAPLPPPAPSTSVAPHASPARPSPRPAAPQRPVARIAWTEPRPTPAPASAPVPSARPVAPAARPPSVPAQPRPLPSAPGPSARPHAPSAPPPAAPRALTPVPRAPAPSPFSAPAFAAPQRSVTSPLRPTDPALPPVRAPVSPPLSQNPFAAELARGISHPAESPADDIPTLFAEELISEKSLDEVILAFLSADLEQGK